MPISSNQQYAARMIKDKRTGKMYARICPTNELDSYKDQFYQWALLNKYTIHQVAVYLKESMLKGYKPYLKLYACFNHKEIYTLKGDPKYLDATNRVKAIHDLLAEVLQIDDKEFYGSSVEKIDAGEKESFCAVWFDIIKPRGVEEVSKELNNYVVMAQKQE